MTELPAPDGEANPGSGQPWPERLSAVLGPVHRSRSLGGSLRRVVAGGRDLVVKVGVGAEDEVEGLRSLARVAGAPPVPGVVLVETGLLVTEWVDQEPRSPGHEEELGRRLASLHRAP
ncbi:MAG TPA: hypothetical protein VII46_01295, partial [Acidimicrobiales bacterium]